MRRALKLRGAQGKLCVILRRFKISQHMRASEIERRALIGQRIAAANAETRGDFFRRRFGWQIGDRRQHGRTLTVLPIAP